MLRGAIWDLDGTILDSMSAWDHVGENICEAMELNLNRIWMKQSPL